MASKTGFMKAEAGPSSSSTGDIDPLESEPESVVKVKKEILQDWISDTVSANKFFKTGDGSRAPRASNSSNCQIVPRDPMEVCETVVTSDTPDADSDSGSESDAEPSEKPEEGNPVFGIENLPSLNNDLTFGIDISHIKVLKDNGCCKRECVKSFSVEELLMYNLESRNLDYKLDGMNVLDLTILAQMRGMCRTLDQVKTGNGSMNKARERLRMIYTLAGVSICEKLFLLANGIKVKRFRRLLKDFKRNGLRAPAHGNSKKAPKIILPQEIMDRVPAFSVLESLKKTPKKKKPSYENGSPAVEPCGETPKNSLSQEVKKVSPNFSLKFGESSGISIKISKKSLPKKVKDDSSKKTSRKASKKAQDCNFRKSNESPEREVQDDLLGFPAAVGLTYSNCSQNTPSQKVQDKIPSFPLTNEAYKSCREPPKNTSSHEVDNQPTFPFTINDLYSYYRETPPKNSLHEVGDQVSAFSTTVGKAYLNKKSPKSNIYPEVQDEGTIYPEAILDS